MCYVKHNIFNSIKIIKFKYYYLSLYNIILIAHYNSFSGAVDNNITLKYYLNI